MLFPSAIVHDFDVCRTSFCPDKVDPPRIIDAHAVLAHAIAFQCLQPVAWGGARMKSSVCAASSWASLRSAMEANDLDRRGCMPSHLNDWIMEPFCYAKRNIASESFKQGRGNTHKTERPQPRTLR